MTTNQFSVSLDSGIALELSRWGKLQQEVLHYSIGASDLVHAHKVTFQPITKTAYMERYQTPTNQPVTP